MGHPASLKWADRPESPVKMRKEMDTDRKWGEGMDTTEYDRMNGYN